MKQYDVVPQTTEEYIALQAAEFRPVLEQLCTIIRSLVPQATESISYQIPCFKYHFMLVGIGTSKKYCSFYTMSPPLVQKMKKELKDLKLSGTTLHFSADEPLPTALIQKIITARIIENELKAMKKK